MKRSLQRGVSLIEAIVAMAVMAFGMMAVVGLQTTLRQNSDIAKQRSEAVRFAEEAIEEWRRFSEMGVVALPKMGYGNIQTLPNETKAGLNAIYVLSRNVTLGQGWKSITVQVSWVDRADQTQTVTLNSIVAAADPALSGILTMAPGGGLAAMAPVGRNQAIPAQADMRGDKSIFMPPVPGGGVLWVFDNLTGVIVGVCNTVVTGQAQVTQADTQACVDSTSGVGVQLSGFVRFATDNPPSGATKHSAAVAENPPNTAFNLGVVLTNLSSDGNPNPTYVCYTNAPTSYLTTQTAVAYRCAILFNVGAPLVWSAIAEVTPQPFLFDLPTGYSPWALAVDAVDAADARASRYRICRYTPATSDAQSIPNQLHPRQYTDVRATEPLTNQNFLVIRAGSDLEDGNGGTAFTCPTDVPPDPANGDFVNSNTLPHQPPPPTPP